MMIMLSSQKVCTTPASTSASVNVSFQQLDIDVVMCNIICLLCSFCYLDLSLSSPLKMRDLMIQYLLR